MLFDLHNDFPTRFLNADYCRFTVPEGHITAVIWTSDFESDAERRVNDIAKRLKSSSHTPIAIEDIGFLAGGERFKNFDFTKYFYCSLTWNHNNGFAGGAMDDGELTELGKSVIKVMEHNGCYVDLAHLNRKSFFQVLDSSKNVLCSHTGFNDNARSLNDEQIKALVERNAVIGLCTVQAFTSATSAVGFADEVDRFVQNYGYDCLALGTDFNGSDDIPQDINDYDKLLKIQDILFSRGYTRETVNKIFFENANTLYRKER